MAKDYYETLGVNKNSSKDEIKSAFRKLAHQYHPDKKTGNESKFKEVNEAYSVLSDDKKRAEYDAYGRVFSGAGGNSQQGPFGGGTGFEGFDFSGFSNGQGFQDFDLGDIFGDLFGGGRSRERVKRGRDISIDIELSFKESIFGTERSVLLNKTGVCSLCKGSGAEKGSEMNTCGACNGKGKIHEVKKSFIGSFATVKTCDTCHGKGSVPRKRCSECLGLGVAKKEHEIKVKIPSGINDGEMIRLTGAGEAISNGVSGDLYIKIHVKKHPFFRKEKNNLEMDLNIKLTDALLGAEYKIDTLDGEIKIKIPELVSFGEILRVRGKGVPIEDSKKRGDLMIKINIELPRKLSKDVKKIVEGLKKEGI